MRLCLVSLIVFFCAKLPAQSTNALEGEILPTPGIDRGELSVFLEEADTPSQNKMRADVDTSGGFYFYGIKPGSYRLQVIGRSGRILVTRLVQVNSAGDFITLSLPERREPAPLQGTVSVASLMHKPTKPAYKACLRAQRFSRAHDYEHAAEELEKAVSLDPLYAAAFGNLGAQYARLARWQEAAAALRKAIQLDPGTSAYYVNLSVVLTSTNDDREAEEAAIRAVKLDGSNPRAHLLLGFLMSKRPESRAAAIPHLEYAARQIPKAHLMLSRLYQTAGQAARAYQETQLYEASVKSQRQP